MESGVDELIGDLKDNGVIDADEQDLGSILVERLEPLEGKSALVNHHLYTVKGK